ncbi:hypothetical protein HGRIS_008061 [Hohenbuehelia grisea]|uniref:AB hydrolase-1 domain-containing protein n=1 Tax=Hohenbuehelia grisea TaxID=104357 RepID=A0ABR3J718_9AGAR
MDPAHYKDLKTSRGVNYHYYVQQKSDGDSPVLLLLHGFPSTSYDWRFQVAFFKERGFGLIVPDMLGYGKTDKPTETEPYKGTLISKDIIDILDAENVRQAVVIGHDWGCKITGRLANLYPDRFLGFGFLAVGYSPPRPDFDLDVVLAQTKKAVGYELFGYWKFFSEPDAANLIEKNWDSFFSALFPADPKLWVSIIGPTGALKEWIASGKTTDVAPWLTEEVSFFVSSSIVPLTGSLFQDRKIQTDGLLSTGGIAGSLCWYKILTSGINAEDDKSIPVESYVLEKPVFFGGAKRDYIALSAFGKQGVSQATKNHVIKEFDASHWVHLEKKDEVNDALLDWIEITVLKTRQ